MIRQRIKAGRERAVAQGVKLGRPKVDRATERNVRKQLLGLGQARCSSRHVLHVGGLVLTSTPSNGVSCGARACAHARDTTGGPRITLHHPTRGSVDPWANGARLYPSPASRSEYPALPVRVFPVRSSRADGSLCHSLHDAAPQKGISAGGNLEVRRIPRFKHVSRLALEAGAHAHARAIHCAHPPL